MAEQRSVSRSTRCRCFTSVWRVASSGGPCSSVRTMSFAKVRMPASGLLISWAIEAESFPSEVSFSRAHELVLRGAERRGPLLDLALEAVHEARRARASSRGASASCR